MVAYKINGKRPGALAQSVCQVLRTLQTRVRIQARAFMTFVCFGFYGCVVLENGKGGTALTVGLIMLV